MGAHSERDGPCMEEVLPMDHLAWSSGYDGVSSGRRPPTVTIGGQTPSGCLSQGSLDRKYARIEATYIKTLAFRTARSRLEDYGHVTLLGAPGEGKTSLALVLCQEYQRKDYKVVFVHDVHTFDPCICKQRKQSMLLLFDDVFGNYGKPSASHNMRSVLQDVLNELSQQGNIRNRRKTFRDLRVIFTSKTYYFREYTPKLLQFTVSLFKEETVVDLTKNKLTSEERRQITSSMLDHHEVSDVTDSDIGFISSSSDTTFGFPLLCKLFCSRETFRRSGLKFFDEPMLYLRADVDAIINELSGRTAVFILLVLLGGRLDLVSFQKGSHSNNDSQSLFRIIRDDFPMCTKTMIWQEAHNFDGTYLTLDDHVATFTHPVILDAVACSFGRLNPGLLLERCPLKFIKTRVVLESDDDRNADKTELSLLSISPSLYQVLLHRFVEEIKNRHFEMTITHDLFQMLEMVETLFDELSDHIVDIVNSKDILTNHHFLYWATYSPSIKFVQKYLEVSNRKEADIYAGLKACSMNGNVTALKLLIQTLPVFEPNHRYRNGRTLLMFAAEEGKELVFEYLLKLKANVSLRDRYGRNAFMYTCTSGNTRLAIMILDSETINLTDEDGWTPSIICSHLGHLKLLNLLVTNGADVSQRGPVGYNCLHAASSMGHNPVVEYLLSIPSVEVNATDGYLRTSIMWASSGGNWGVFQTLVSAGADLLRSDDEAQQCLAYACASGNINILSHLLDRKIYDINRKGLYNLTPLMVASLAGNTEVFDKLVSEGADMYSCDMDNDDCLSLATDTGRTNMVKHLLSTGLFNIDNRGNEGRTAIMNAALKGHEDTFHCLLEHGADISLQDFNDTHLLALAVLGGSTDIIKTLLSKQRVDVNAVGGRGRTPVMMAALEGNLDLVELFVSAGADLTQSDSITYDCLMLATAEGHLNIVKSAVDRYGFNINRRGQHGQTALMLAARHGHKDIFEFLVSKGADVTLVDEYDEDCLMLACVGGSLDIVKYLLSLNRFDVNKRERLSWAPILATCRHGYKELFDLLQANSANIQASLDNGSNCLLLACIGNSVDILQYLMSTNLFDLSQKWEHNRDLVMITCSHGNKNVFDVLIAAGMGTTQIDDQGNDCLILACVGGNIDIVKYLISLGSFNINGKGKQGVTPLFISARYGHLEVFKLLLDLGADVRAETDNGDNCLVHAVLGGNLDIAKTLLSSGFDANARGKHNGTPAIAAASTSNASMLQLLVSYGADLSLSDDCGYDCLMSACIDGNLNTLRCILGFKMVDINNATEIGLTPLSASVVNGHCDIFEVLVAEGADTSVKVSNDTGCLSVACRNGYTLLVEAMLRMNLYDINIRGQHDQTPLIASIIGGHPEVFDMLYTAGADVTLCDEFGSGCLYWACAKGPVSLVEELLLTGQLDIDKTGENGRTPVMIAAAVGQEDIFFRLLKENPSLLISDAFNNDILCLAVVGGSINIVSKLLATKCFDVNKRAQYGRTPFQVASEKGNYEMVILLFDNGGDFRTTDDSGNDMLISACHGGNVNIVEFVVTMSNADINGRRCQMGTAPILSAASYGHIETFNWLLSKGADPSAVAGPAPGNDCLMMAAASGHTEFVHLLLGLDIFDINRLGQYRRTPVMQAAIGGHEGVFVALVEAGADLTLIDEELNNTLILAAAGGDTDIVSCIISQKVLDVNSRGEEGKTALMFAAMNDHSDVIRVLVEAGAGLSMVDENGMSCFQLADIGGNVDICRYLQHVQ